MKKYGITFVGIISLCICLCSCHNHNTTGVITTHNSHATEEETFDPYIEGNKKIVGWEDEEIELFVKRYEWLMNKTGTGLRIEIIEQGTGDYFKEGDVVKVKYKTSLLNGEKIYNSKSDGDKVFVVDKSQEITGLHEAVKMMKSGGKARLIIPSHLAYGVAGDGDKIEGRKTIVMEIVVSKLEQ